MVSVDVGDVAERIEGIEGCYLAPSEPADLAAKLELVRLSRKRLDGGSRLEELSIVKAAEKLKRCYEEVISERGPFRVCASLDFPPSEQRAETRLRVSA